MTKNPFAEIPPRVLVTFYRNVLGITQTAAAELTGCKQANVAAYENGRYACDKYERMMMRHFGGNEFYGSLSTREITGLRSLLSGNLTDKARKCYHYHPY